MKGERASPGPAGVGKRPGWAAPGRLVDGLEGGRLVFAYVDASDVKGKDEHVMSGLEMTFPGPDRLVHEWTSKVGGQEQTGRFEFVRKK